MKASDYIVDVLTQKKVPAVFELVGGMITHIIDSLCVNRGIETISMHHEQGAAFAAEAMGRLTGIPGIAMATSGPGATNLLTGIGSCYFDSSPSIFLTGQVNRHEQRGDRRIRQLGFQETDITSMAKPVTKKAVLLNDAKELPNALEDAFHLATCGRPGPVLLDIPMDVQSENVDPAWLTATHPATVVATAESDLVAVREGLLRARKPLILAGGGIRSGQAIGAFRELVNSINVPVVHSLMGVDLLPYEHLLNFGMIGSYGNRWANLSLSECDCILVVGSRLDVRQTGADTAGFKGNREIFHIDCEPGEVNNRVKGCYAILSEIRPALTALKEVLVPVRNELARNAEGWRGEIASLRSKWPDTDEIKGVEGINPNVFMHVLSKASTHVPAYVVDVGQHQMWAAQSLELQEEQRFLTSGGMGSMGFGLPAGIGSAVALKGQPVVVIAGDGSFQCNIQELQTVVRLGLPIKMVVINNGCHGMVRQFQESYFNGRYQSTMWGYSAPNFEHVAAAYGIPAKTVSDPYQLQHSCSWLHSDGAAPALLQVMVSPRANAYPKLAFGKGLSAMEPQEKPVEMEGT